MRKHGFEVTPHYAELTTAWRAEFVHGKGGRVLGVNSEMDALPGVGHACGHNLIAAGGVGVALAVKAAMEKHNINGKIILLGTPAEEGGGGKVLLIQRGAYKEMDLCVMYVFCNLTKSFDRDTDAHIGNLVGRIPRRGPLIPPRLGRVWRCNQFRWSILDTRTHTHEYS